MGGGYYWGALDTGLVGYLKIIYTGLLLAAYAWF